jgi:hypothetical protein
VFNHTQFFKPDAKITNGPSFGRVTRAIDPKLFQLALRLSFSRNLPAMAGRMNDKTEAGLLCVVLLRSSTIALDPERKVVTAKSCNTRPSPARWHFTAQSN